MTILKSLSVSQLRNLAAVPLTFSDKYNLIYGINGSGKTSLLEAVYLAGHGKSFRSHIKSRIINYAHEKLTIFAVFQASSDPFNQECKVGIEKPALGQNIIKLNGEHLSSVAGLIKLLPIQLINPDSYQILEDGPDVRRTFLDWGVFHVKHDFHEVWQQYSRCLKQRNSSLRVRQSMDVCQSWDIELVKYGAQLSEMRAAHLAKLAPIFNDLIVKLGISDLVEMNYYFGWDQEMSLDAALKATIHRDLSQGFTSKGPHRADVRLTIAGVPSDDVLSRGQEKLVVAALQLAQGLLLEQELNVTPIYLLDDLPSELDQHRREALFNLLTHINGQFFITATEKELFPSSFLEQGKLFHVKQGNISFES